VSSQMSYQIRENYLGSVISLHNLSLPNGMYFYNLSIHNKAIAKGKFTIIK
jgi:hypothetical protein